MTPTRQPAEPADLQEERRQPKKLTPYQRIVRAFKTGKGVLLSPRDIDALNLDTAIVHRAELDDEAQKEQR